MTAAVAWIASAGAAAMKTGATGAATAEASTGETAASGTTPCYTPNVTRLLVLGCPPELFTIPMATVAVAAASAAAAAVAAAAG